VQRELVSAGLSRMNLNTTSASKGQCRRASAALL
jgi:hypothetical protein